MNTITNNSRNLFETSFNSSTIYKDNSITIYKEFKSRMLQVSFKPTRKNIKIESTSDCVRFLNIIWDNNLFNIQEQFYVVFLDKYNSLISWTCLNTGSADECMIDVKLLLAMAITCLASKIIVSHNHPIGNPNPSDPDRVLTKKLNDDAKYLGLKLIDHVILSQFGHYSFMEKGGLK